MSDFLFTESSPDVLGEVVDGVVVFPTSNADVQEQTNEERLTGQVLSFHARKGFGFIQELDTGTQYFVHHSQLRPKHAPIVDGWKPTLYSGEYVRFSVGPNPHVPNQTCALNVTGLGLGLMCDKAAWRVLFYRNDKEQKQDSNE